ncbi:hypothetical protein [Ornithinimicrobium sp. LYQ103]|uniref:hypothetical protein n=1 Tax=Ornithinimicrobium sp. LYQ103 TaxID=3378796 RepID=UPI00385407E1
MKYSRLTVAVTLSSALVLSACTGGDTPDAASTTPAADAVSTEDTALTSTPDLAATSDDATTTTSAGTDDASQTTVAMSTEEDEAVLSVEDAETVAAALLEARHEAFQGDGEDARDAQQRAFMSTARTAAEAADRLEGVLGEPAEEGGDTVPEPNVLAISRDDGELPQLLLVQTVPDDGVPLLHLMESRTGEQKDFRIVWEAPMLPGTSVPTFDRRSVGTPVLRDGTGDLAVPPHETLKVLASYISWPQPEEVPDYRTHGYSPAVREAAQQQADAVADQADLREKNWIVSDDTRTLLFEDGTGFVLGSLLRDTTFTVRPSSVLTPPDTFAVFADDEEITDEAVLRTSVFVALRVASSEQDLKPEMIAAREQLVDAWGS